MKVNIVIDFDLAMSFIDERNKYIAVLESFKTEDEWSEKQKLKIQTDLQKQRVEILFEKIQNSTVEQLEAWYKYYSSPVEPFCESLKLDLSNITDKPLTDEEICGENFLRFFTMFPKTIATDPFQ